MQSGEVMLKIVESLRNLDYQQLLTVYQEQLAMSAARGGERSFYEDLSLFLSEGGHFCCLWVPQGRYTACVRVEPYRDGFLLTCLETAPLCRRQGFAFDLLTSVLRHLSRQGCKCVYVHVKKRNIPSVSLHKKAGFYIIADYAHLVDGTVSQNYVTLKIDLP